MTLDTLIENAQKLRRRMGGLTEVGVFITPCSPVSTQSFSGLALVAYEEQPVVMPRPVGQTTSQTELKNFVMLEKVI